MDGPSPVCPSRPGKLCSLPSWPAAGSSVCRLALLDSGDVGLSFSPRYFIVVSPQRTHCTAWHCGLQLSTESFRLGSLVGAFNHIVIAVVAAINATTVSASKGQAHPRSINPNQAEIVRITAVFSVGSLIFVRLTVVMHPTTRPELCRRVAWCRTGKLVDLYHVANKLTSPGRLVVHRTCEARGRPVAQSFSSPKERLSLRSRLDEPDVRPSLSTPNAVDLFHPALVTRLWEVVHQQLLQAS